MVITIMLSTRGVVGAYVEKCNVFSDHKREGQRAVEPASAGSQVCYNLFPVHHLWNDYELLSE